jgi:hypothetical protein
MQELMRLQQSESFIKPRTFRPDLSEATQILLLNALSFDTARRPQNARIFTEDLAQALLGKITADDARATIVVPSPNQDSTPGVIDVPNTEIYPVENTVAQARATEANAGARTSAPNLPPRGTVNVPAGRETIAKPQGRKFPLIPLLIIALIAATAIIAVKTLWPSVWPGSTGGVTQSPTPQTASPSPGAPGTELTLTYWVTVRQKNSPGRAPFQVPGEMYFNPGDILHFSFTSPQTGYLYIINEGPPVAGQASSFNFLFPTTTTNQGSAQISGGKTVRIPGHDEGFELDKEQGVEKLWLIWSASEVAD